MSIVTKTGDKGVTGLFGGARVSKDSVRLHAYGTVDELNAVLGMALAEGMPDESARQLQWIQHLLFRVGADLATPMESAAKTRRVGKIHTEKIGRWIGEYETLLPAQTAFILPGGARAGAALHLARTVCRRAERWTVALGKEEQINREVATCLNRLGDYFFILARFVNRQSGKGDVEVKY